jgi:hypothetical protein
MLEIRYDAGSNKLLILHILHILKARVEDNCVALTLYGWHLMGNGVPAAC